MIAEPNGQGCSRDTPLPKNRVVVPALIGLAALIFVLRLHTYNEPLERDLTTYAVVAHELLGGRALYSDLWDHKPPAIHVTYAVGELVAGYGRDSIFFLSVTASVLIMLACYRAGSVMGGGTAGGLIAATLWALVSGDLALEANQPNTEIFINVFLTAAFAIFLRTEKRSLGWRGCLPGGFMLCPGLTLQTGCDHGSGGDRLRLFAVAAGRVSQTSICRDRNRRCSRSVGLGGGIRLFRCPASRRRFH